MKNDHDDSVFYLGLTMAGAVSAGCYTAGAIDYLFEMLQLWEEARHGKIDGIDPKLVPKHKVVIDAMGGASAGGMVTMMTAIYALEGAINPVKEVPKDPMSKHNILYDSWVHLNDSEKHTFDQLWDTDDLERDQKLISLFNSKAIDTIAERAFTFSGERRLGDQMLNMPGYISRDLELLLSHTMLRGIPLEVDFTSPISAGMKSANSHTTFEHFMVSHFKFNARPDDYPEGYLELDPYSEKTAACMKASTIATGAFPLGLKFRSLNQFNDAYYKSVINRIVYANFGIDNPDTKKLINLSSFPDGFKTLTIDGGAINNEPYSEVMSILKSRHAAAGKFKCYGLVMIDPFPDRSVNEPYEEPEDLIDVLPEILTTLRNQSKVKRAETIADYKNEYRGEIYPRRNYPDKPTEPYPIASASFGAFGGFLDIHFRQHDFFLGRDNARNFYRYFFSLPYYPDEPEKNHPIHSSDLWTPEAVQKFLISKTDPITQKTTFYLPIIPDMTMVTDNETVATRRNFYTIPDRPQFDASKLMELDRPIRKRTVQIIRLLKLKFLNPADAADQVANDLTNGWMDLHYRRKPKGKLRSWFWRAFINIGVFFAGKWAARKVSRKLIETILLDLEKMRLLKKAPPRKSTDEN